MLRSVEVNWGNLVEICSAPEVDRGLAEFELPAVALSRPGIADMAITDSRSGIDLVVADHGTIVSQTDDGHPIHALIFGHATVDDLVAIEKVAVGANAFEVFGDGLLHERRVLLRQRVRSEER